MVDMESRATLLQPSVVNYQREANHLTQDDSSSTSFLRPEYQRFRGDDHNAEKLSRPSASIYSILLDILLCVVALCFLGKALQHPQFFAANLPRSTRWPGSLDEESAYRNHSRKSVRRCNEIGTCCLFYTS